MATPKSAQNSLISLDPRFENMLEIERKQLKNKYKSALPGKELALEYEDISLNGTTELFSQSPSTPPYSRERPVAHLYIAHEKNYLAILKTLDGITPQADPKSEVDPLEQFLK